MQQFAIAFTFLAPIVFGALCWKFGTLRLQEIICRSLALCLVAFELGNIADKIVHGSPVGLALPMQLCDLALIAVAGSLWFRWQLGFELGYFWGLAGTSQALFTPAIDREEVWWRLFVFFFSHALIVASVLHLLLTERCRPWRRSLLRVFICSEIYVFAALVVNNFTGGNYGFLSHRPSQPSLLDLFSTTHWLYVAEINALALLLFPALYVPWLLWDFAVKARPGAAPTRPL